MTPCTHVRANAHARRMLCDARVHAIVAGAGSVDESSTSSSKRSRSAAASAGKTVADDDWRSPVYTVIAVNVLVFALVHLLHLVPAFLLQLGLGKAFGWWQVLTSGFTHAGPEHLAETVFFVYTFGRLVERAHGLAGLWLTYLSSVLGTRVGRTCKLASQQAQHLLHDAHVDMWICASSTAQPNYACNDYIM